MAISRPSGYEGRGLDSSSQATEDETESDRGDSRPYQYHSLTRITCLLPERFPGHRHQQQQQHSPPRAVWVENGSRMR
jgi:hypothetical protein